MAIRVQVTGGHLRKWRDITSPVRPPHKRSNFAGHPITNGANSDDTIKQAQFCPSAAMPSQFHSFHAHNNSMSSSVARVGGGHTITFCKQLLLLLLLLHRSNPMQLKQNGGYVGYEGHWKVSGGRDLLQNLMLWPPIAMWMLWNRLEDWPEIRLCSSQAEMWIHPLVLSPNANHHTDYWSELGLPLVSFRKSKEAHQAWSF